MELVIQELVLSIPERENPGFANHRLQDTGSLTYLRELRLLSIEWIQKE